VCDEAEDAPYRTSDVGHNPATLFHVAHEVLAAAWPEAVVASLHGMRRTDGTSIIVSGGSREKCPGDDAVGGPSPRRAAGSPGRGYGGGELRRRERRPASLPPAVRLHQRAGPLAQRQPERLRGGHGRPVGPVHPPRADLGRVGEFERGRARWAEYPNLSAVLRATVAAIPCASADRPR